MIRVNDKEVSFEAGMTVADAIEISGIAISSMIIVMVNGESIALNAINEIELSEGTNIKLLTLLSGG